METPQYEGDAQAACLVCLPCLVTPTPDFEVILIALIIEGAGV